MSSANFVTPAHLERPSTFRTDDPTTRRARPLPRRPPFPPPLEPPAMEHLLVRLSHPPGRQLHRLEDTDVAGAAAQSAGQSLADLLARRLGPRVEERLGGT